MGIVIEIARSRRDPPPARQSAGAYSDTLARFEQALGDPAAPGPFSFESAGERDRSESYPRDAIDCLGRIGAPHLQVPAGEGGQLQSLEQLIAASYAVGRRDASVALSAGLQMWSQLVWMAGSAAQRAAMRALLDENAAICLAASERDHGADLLSTSCVAVPDQGGWRLHGEKWPIGSATVCRAALVLARTRAERGPRSLSWFFVGPEALGSRHSLRLPKVPTVGMRASDVSGLAFDALPVGRDSPIGGEGAGLELAIKLFQLTRPLVASLALGPGDTAVRIAGQFALSRELYGHRASELPSVRRALVRAWADLLVAELVAATTARGAHVDPKGLASASLVAKITVPAMVHASVAQAARVLGARALVRDHARGTFERVERDQRVASVLDGSTEVCVRTLAVQLPVLLREAATTGGDALARVSTADAAIPPLAYDALEVAPRHAALTLSALGALVLNRTSAPRSLGDAAESIARQAVVARTSLQDEVGRILRDAAEPGGTLALDDAAFKYASLHALAACTAFAVCNTGRGLITERPSFLWMAARRLGMPALVDAPAEHDLIDDLFEAFRLRIDGGRLLSAFDSPGAWHE